VSTYHTSVLLHESIEALHIQPAGIYVDVTFGGGGHSAAILEKLGPQGRLIAFDQDPDAANNIAADERLTFIAANFKHLKKYLRLHGITQVNGILADLGVSSYQFDTAERGFSYRFDGPLDMRMDKQNEVTAATVLNTYDELMLQQMFSKYGEVTNAKTLAQQIVHERKRKHFESTAELVAVAQQLAKGNEWSYLSQVFQALRMEVNDEIGVLQELMKQAAEVLVPGGRLAIITFHSLEEKAVKNYMRYGTFHDEPEKDLYGNFQTPLKLITKKPLQASQEEQQQNRRSRSAKLRVAEKT
jgi:16S rRNA (cytosine1402-N4)-methyltransferase